MKTTYCCVAISFFFSSILPLSPRPLLLYISLLLIPVYFKSFCRFLCQYIIHSSSLIVSLILSCISDLPLPHYLSYSLFVILPLSFYCSDTLFLFLCLSQYQYITLCFCLPICSYFFLLFLVLPFPFFFALLVALFLSLCVSLSLFFIFLLMLSDTI